MRLWHKDLIPVLPRQQLLGQWRECCLIARSIKETGSPNHILVNKIMDYPISDFYHYGMLVSQELLRRYYKCDFNKFSQHFDDPSSMGIEFDQAALFKDWHNDRYLRQCFCNLQEKFDCGGVPVAQWAEVVCFMQGRPVSK